MNLSKSYPFLALGLAGLASLVVFSSSSVLAYGTNTYTNDTTGVPVCGSPVPAKAWLYKAVAAGGGKVDLYWDKVDGATSWTVAYGVKSGVYIYGASNIGNSDSRGLSITMLPPQKYYFVVRANNNCMPGPFSNEWAVSVGGGGAPVFATNLTRVMPAETSFPNPTPTPIATVRPSSVPNMPTVTFAPQSRATPLPLATPAPKPRGFFGWLSQLFGGLFR